MFSPCNSCRDKLQFLFVFVNSESSFPSSCIRSLEASGKLAGRAVHLDGIRDRGALVLLRLRGARGDSIHADGLADDVRWRVRNAQSLGGQLEPGLPLALRDRKKSRYRVWPVV